MKGENYVKKTFPTRDIGRRKRYPLLLFYQRCTHSPCEAYAKSSGRLHKMKASLRAKYEADKSTTTAASAVTLAFNAGDVKLRASMTDATVVNGPSLNGLALALEKPGSFTIDYNVPKKDFRFLFMNTIKVSDKPLNLVYSHSRGDQRTMLDGTLVIDSANKVSANHVFGSGNCKLKYTYIHGGVTTFEPSYDLAKDSWDFAVSRKVYSDYVLRAVYQTSNQNLALDLSTKTKAIGSYKVSNHRPIFGDPNEYMNEKLKRVQSVLTLKTVTP